MKKIIFIIAVLLVLCGCTGISRSQQKQIDKTIAEYSEKLIGPTWWDQKGKFSYRFYADGTVEEDGYLSEPGSWHISFGEQYNENTDLSKLSKKFIENYCDYFVRFISPAYKVEETHRNLRIRFDDDGNLYLYDELFLPGMDIIHEIPEDAYLDPFFFGNYKANNWGVFGYEYEAGKIGELLVFQDDGYAAETTGSFNGELINPSIYTWAFKDDYLYLEALRSEEYIAEYGKDIKVYKVEKEADGNFYLTDYLDREGNSRRHYVITDKLDLYAQ